MLTDIVNRNNIITTIQIEVGTEFHRYISYGHREFYREPHISMIAL